MNKNKSMLEKKPSQWILAFVVIVLFFVSMNGFSPTGLVPLTTSAVEPDFNITLTSQFLAGTFNKTYSNSGELGLGYFTTFDNETEFNNTWKVPAVNPVIFV